MWGKFRAKASHRRRTATASGRRRGAGLAAVSPCSYRGAWRAHGSNGNGWQSRLRPVQWQLVVPSLRAAIACSGDRLLSLTGYQAQTDKGIDPRPRQMEADRLAAAQSEGNAKAAAVAAALTEHARHSLSLAEVWPIYIAARKHKWSAGHLQNHMTLTAAGRPAEEARQGTDRRWAMAPLMPPALADLTAERVAVWLEKESAERPTNAAQMQCVASATRSSAPTCKPCC